MRGKRDYIYGRTAAECNRKWREAKTLRARGKPVKPPARMTVREYLLGWLERRKPPRVSETTYRVDTGSVQHHWIATIGDVVLAELTPEHVELAIAFLGSPDHPDSPHLATSTIDRAHRLLVNALNEALRPPRKVDFNAAALAKKPAIEEGERTVLGLEQIPIFIEAIREEYFGAAYLLALTTGLRSSEALALTWDDIEPETIHVARSLHRLPGKRVVVKGPKSRRGRRTLPLLPILTPALDAHREKQQAEWALRGRAWTTGELVFTSAREGEAVYGSYLNRRLGVVLTRAGLPRLKFHELRHSFDSLLTYLEVPTRVKMELMGHSSVAMTEVRYAHLLGPELREAGARFEALLRGESPQGKAVKKLSAR